MGGFPENFPTWSMPNEGRGQRGTAIFKMDELGSASFLPTLWEREEPDTRDWDFDPFIKNLPPRTLPHQHLGEGEKQWPTLGGRGPQQAGRAHLPAEGRAGLSSEKLPLTLAGPLPPPLVPGLEGPRCLGLPMSKCSRPSEGPWVCPTPSAPAPLFPPPVADSGTHCKLDEGPGVREKTLRASLSPSAKWG